MKAWVVFMNATCNPENSKNMPCNEIFVSCNDQSLILAFENLL